MYYGKAKVMVEDNSDYYYLSFFADRGKLCPAYAIVIYHSDTLLK